MIHALIKDPCLICEVVYFFNHSKLLKSCTKFYENFVKSEEFLNFYRNRGPIVDGILAGGLITDWKLDCRITEINYDSDKVYSPARDEGIEEVDLLFQWLTE